MLPLSSRIIWIMTVTVTFCLLVDEVCPLQRKQLRDLEDLLNDEERAMEEEIQDIQDMKTELRKKSSKLEINSRQKIKKGDSGGSATSHKRNIVKAREGENEAAPARLPKTPKPPEKVQK